MRARPLTLTPVPSGDRVITRNGRLWRNTHHSPDRYQSLWECPATGGGATWALLDSGAHGAVWAYRSADWAVAS